jgi:hypothetical protein
MRLGDQGKMGLSESGTSRHGGNETWGTGDYGKMGLKDWLKIGEMGLVQKVGFVI